MSIMRWTRRCIIVVFLLTFQLIISAVHINAQTLALQDSATSIWVQKAEEFFKRASDVPKCYSFSFELLDEHLRGDDSSAILLSTLGRVTIDQFNARVDYQTESIGQVVEILYFSGLQAGEVRLRFFGSGPTFNVQEMGKNAKDSVFLENYFFRNPYAYAIHGWSEVRMGYMQTLADLKKLKVIWTTRKESGGMEFGLLSSDGTYIREYTFGGHPDWAPVSLRVRKKPQVYMSDTVVTQEIADSWPVFMQVSSQWEKTGKEQIWLPTICKFEYSYAGNREVSHWRSAMWEFGDEVERSPLDPTKFNASHLHPQFFEELASQIKDDTMRSED